MWGFLCRVFYGFVLGMSVLAPGFSGSIVAIAMGIYHDLLRIISIPFKRLKENMVFCLPLGIGIALSLVVFVVAFSYLLETFEKATYLLFVGLIAGHMPVIFSAAKKHGFRKFNLFCGIVAMIVAVALAFMAFGGDSGSDTATGLGHDGLTASWPLLILSGLAAGSALMVPGMSSSMILIILGIYGQLISAAKSLLQGNFDYLLPIGVFALCAIIGLVLASRIIKAFFEKIPALAYTMLLGFIFGSLTGMLVQSLSLNDPGFIWWHGVVAFAAGAGLSILFVALSTGGKKVESSEP